MRSLAAPQLDDAAGSGVVTDEVKNSVDDIPRWDQGRGFWNVMRLYPIRGLVSWP